MALRKRTKTRFSARMVPGATPAAEMPGFTPPQLATLKLKPPAGDRWIHEIKYDGYRVQVQVDRGKVRVFTRSGLDWTKKFHLIAESFEGLPIERGIFDGEVVVIKNGRTDSAPPPGRARRRPAAFDDPLYIRSPVFGWLRPAEVAAA